MLLSLGRISEKYTFIDEARAIVQELGLPIYATPGTAEALHQVGIECTSLSKDEGEGSAVKVIDEGLVDLVINVPREYDEMGRPDGYLIRRRAVDAEIPLVTDLMLARALVEAMRFRNSPAALRINAWDEYMARQPMALR